MQHVVSALDSSTTTSSRASLRLVTRSASVPASAPPAATSDELPGREREQRLVDQSRDAHFAVRRRFRELAPEVAGTGLEFLYDQARRIDGELAGLYQARAAVLAHRLQRTAGPADTPRPVAPSAPSAAMPASSAEPRSTTELSIEERALVMRLRAASERDRRTLLHLAVRFSDAHRLQR